MASSKMNIPKTIHVGYNERRDTYTGKLAYVIYTDNKGKKRKETSWEGWRQQKLGSDDYENEPMSGFVLNKGVGGARQSYGWNARNEYIRVYDPRGFEFEISVANLLFILQECTSSRGKGLEGEFVYSWDGKELVLLPTSSQEYVECSKFTNFQTKKLSASDMVEGCSYLMKDMSEVMYLGRHNYFEEHWRGGYRPLGKRHVFVNLQSGSYTTEGGYTKIAAKTSEKALPQYANTLEKFLKSKFSNEVLEVKITKKAVTSATFKDLTSYNPHTFVIKENDKYFAYQIQKNDRYSYHSRSVSGDFKITKSKKEFKPTITGGLCALPRIASQYGKGERDTKGISTAELLKKEFYSVLLVTKKGKDYDLLKD